MNMINMLGAYTPCKLHERVLQVVHCSSIAAATVGSKQKSFRVSCADFGSQRKLTGYRTFGRSFGSGKAVLRRSRIFEEIQARAGMDEGLVIVIMGVSGAGKSTTGELLGKDLDCPFLDADDFHPAENKEKMRNGISLTEDDRLPWLEKLRDAMAEYINSGKIAILACSALRKSYRCILCSAAGSSPRKVVFVHLKGNHELFESRLTARHKEGNHFMPPSLLQSQLDLLEEDEKDSGSSFVNVDASLSPQTIVNHIKHELLSGSLSMAEEPGL